MARKRDEPVRLTRIYTRGGDRGETSLGDGSRVSKLDPLVRAYGEVDELNSLLGWAQVEAQDERLARIQNELFDLGADLSVPWVEGDGRLRIGQDGDRPPRGRLRRGERRRCPELRSFVLPGGSEAAARLHVARAVCRRVERAGARGGGGRGTINPLAPVYLNRLSDLLFILARAAQRRRARSRCGGRAGAA